MTQEHASAAAAEHQDGAAEAVAVWGKNDDGGVMQGAGGEGTAVEADGTDDDFATPGADSTPIGVEEVNSNHAGDPFGFGGEQGGDGGEGAESGAVLDEVTAVEEPVCATAGQYGQYAGEEEEREEEISSDLTPAAAPQEVPVEQRDVEDETDTGADGADFSEVGLEASANEASTILDDATPRAEADPFGGPPQVAGDLFGAPSQADENIFAGAHPGDDPFAQIQPAAAQEEGPFSQTQPQVAETSAEHQGQEEASVEPEVAYEQPTQDASSLFGGTCAVADPFETIAPVDARSIVETPPVEQQQEQQATHDASSLFGGPSDAAGDASSLFGGPSTVDDPFSQMQSAASHHDPFAVPAAAHDVQHAPAADPFASSAPAADPFASSAPSEDPFSVGAAPVESAATSDPFSSGTAVQNTDVSSLFGGAPTEVPDLFGGGSYAANDPFASAVGQHATSEASFFDSLASTPAQQQQQQQQQQSYEQQQQQQQPYGYNGQAGGYGFDQSNSAGQQTQGSSASEGVSAAFDVGFTSQTSEEDVQYPWSRNLDPNTGCIYYFNAQTGVSQWEPPAKEVPATPAPAADSQAAQQQSPEGSQQAVDSHQQVAQNAYASPYDAQPAAGAEQNYYQQQQQQYGGYNQPEYQQQQAVDYQQPVQQQQVAYEQNQYQQQQQPEVSSHVAQPHDYGYNQAQQVSTSSSSVQQAETRTASASRQQIVPKKGGYQGKIMMPKAVNSSATSNVHEQQQQSAVNQQYAQSQQPDYSNSQYAQQQQQQQQQQPDYSNQYAQPQQPDYSNNQYTQQQQQPQHSYYQPEHQNGYAQHQYQQPAQQQPQNQPQQQQQQPAEAFRMRGNHPIVSFGFGGKLVVLFPKTNRNLNVFNGQPEELTRPQGPVKPAPITVYDMGNMPSMQAAVGEAKAFNGPLGPSVNQQKLQQMIENRADAASDEDKYVRPESQRLMWGILRVIASNAGELTGADAAKTKLIEGELLQVLQDPLAAGGGLMNAQAQNLLCPPSVDETQMQQGTRTMQELLLGGDRDGACKAAMEHQLWAPALLLSSYMDIETYTSVMSEFAKKNFVVGTPLRTLYMLFAGQGPALFEPSEVDPLLDAWQQNLSIILANRTPGDAEVIKLFGDALWNRRGDYCAAQFCYALAGCTPEAITEAGSLADTKLVLVGANHRLCPGACWTPEAISRTEIWEQALRLANPKTCIPALQPYKLHYAMLLADMGMCDKALAYVEHLFSIVKPKNGGSQAYGQRFCSELEMFDHRWTTTPILSCLVHVFS